MKPQWEPGDFIITTGKDGTRHAVGQKFRVTVLPHTTVSCSACGRPKTKERDRQRIYYQRDVPMSGHPGARSALVAQLDDVRVYCNPRADGSIGIVVSKKRLPL